MCEEQKGRRVKDKVGERTREKIVKGFEDHNKNMDPEDHFLLSDIGYGMI